MKFYQIKHLRVTQADCFPHGYNYEIIGYTIDEELIEKLKTIKVKHYKTWPLQHMFNWSVYQIKEIKLLTNFDYFKHGPTQE